ncbi:hypothetical protein ABTM38_19510, partial [Acinetobacter baumannii]
MKRKIDNLKNGLENVEKNLKQKLELIGEFYAESLKKLFWIKINANSRGKLKGSLGEYLKENKNDIIKAIKLKCFVEKKNG